MATDAAQPITVMVHVPKAAGNTLRWIARRQYPGPGRVIEVPKIGRGDPAEFFRALSPEQQRQVLLINDATCVGAHECFERPVRYIALLRDPVKRVLSWDYYATRMKNKKVVPGRTDWSGYRIANKVRDNGQTRIIAGAGDSRWNRDVPVTEETLAQAKRNIDERFPVIGTSERFDETMVLAKRLLGWPRILYRRRNVSRAPHPDLGEPPEALLEQVKDDNIFDAELYVYVDRLLDKAIEAQGLDFLSELEAFKRMNAALEQPPPGLTPTEMSHRAFVEAVAPGVIRAYEEEHPAKAEKPMVRAFRKYVRRFVARAWHRPPDDGERKERSPAV